MTALIEVENLRTSFFVENGEVRAVDGISFSIDAGKTLGLVGESGCGKSATALSIMRLIPKEAGRIVGGRILHRGRDIMALDEREMRRIRGKEISMIFQEPMTSLNPLFTIGFQIVEAINLHQKLGKREAREKAVHMLELVKIAEPHIRVDDYPHQLSGGMRQRAMIAMALSCNPALLLADEPTTALDVTIQAQILELMSELKQQLGMGLLLITHDLGVVAEHADEIAVMYAGRIVERAPADMIFVRPLHPYTIALMNSIPGAGSRKRRLESIPGMVPSPRHWPVGCRFHDRCSRSADLCIREQPLLREFEPGHFAACHFAEYPKS